MPRPRRSRRTLTTLIALVVVSIALITIDLRTSTHSLTSGLRSVAHDVFSPLAGAVNGIFNPIGDFLAGAVHYGALQQENQNLQAMVGRLNEEIAAMQYQSDRHRETASVQGLPFVSAYRTVTARTIELAPSNFEADIIIDKGRDNGVDVGMPVVASGGLIGQVTQASHTTATVQLITDPSSSVGVQFGQKASPYYGVANGEGLRRDLTVSFVSANDPIRRGEILFTNGLAGATFPPGLPVAKVSSIRRGSVQLSVSAKPIANLDHLAYVSVVLWEPPT